MSHAGKVPERPKKQRAATVKAPIAPRTCKKHPHGSRQKRQALIGPQAYGALDADVVPVARTTRLMGCMLNFIMLDQPWITALMSPNGDKYRCINIQLGCSRHRAHRMLKALVVLLAGAAWAAERRLTEHRERQLRDRYQLRQGPAYVSPSVYRGHSGDRYGGRRYADSHKDRQAALEESWEDSRPAKRSRGQRRHGDKRAEKARRRRRSRDYYCASRSSRYSDSCTSSSSWTSSSSTNLLDTSSSSSSSSSSRSRKRKQRKRKDRRKGKRKDKRKGRRKDKRSRRNRRSGSSSSSAEQKLQRTILPDYLKGQDERRHQRTRRRR